MRGFIKSRMENGNIISMCKLFVTLCLLLPCVCKEVCSAGDQEHVGPIKVFTVATDETDGFQRYMRSARVYNITVTRLGGDQEWLGGDMNGLGGGFKVKLLRDALESHKNDNDLIVLFTDAYDVVFSAGLDEIEQKFKETGARILFAAEKYCWPDDELAADYPAVKANASQYLNSGGFIGYASDIYDLIDSPIADDDDDQRFYTRKFLNADVRKRRRMQLDVTSRIFQNLNGAKNDIKLHVDLETNVGVLENIHFLTQPSIIHGNGRSKVDLNAFANYLAKTFNRQCLICEEDRIELQENQLPIITMALIVKEAVPFFDVYLEKIAKINYPPEQMHLFVYNKDSLHEDAIKSFIDESRKRYRSVKTVLAADNLDERRGRELARERAVQKKSDYLFVVDADVHIDDPQLLRELLIFNRQFIAPVVSRHGELWSNFWGALSDSGYYARSPDYVDIVKGHISGMWNVPYVAGVYLVKNVAFKHMRYKHRDLDADMALCRSLREAGVFMYVVNVRIYGHLVNGDAFKTDVERPDFYTLATNKFDWIEKYIHAEYGEQLEENTTIAQPCPDVFWFRIVTDKFCDDLVAIMESHGNWSNGSNKDTRLEGGYEAVPTRDIHMKQVGLDELWLKFLQMFVRPLQEKVFAGYFSNPPRSLMNFVVRYRPDEQPSLRPHQDSSTYTINIALNNVDVDYQGGGCRFLRYNCSITATKKGWMLMHPGRLSHHHEGLKVTNGTRYIMISFVNP